MIDAFLTVDKPAALTSHDVVAQVRRLLGQRRVGHAGTLDPLATGLLVLAAGRATRLLEYVVGADKRYLATVRLGQTTDSYDADGRLLAEHTVDVAEPALRAALDAFRGPIAQVPPMYSAIKRDGQPLYKLARQGVTVPREPRPVTIHQLTLTSWTPPTLALEVHCSSGTYIRSLAHDLGQALGCGAHLAALRRTTVGPFRVADAPPLDALTTANIHDHLLPPETAVAHFPAIHLDADDARRLVQGQRVSRAPSAPEAALARAYDPAGLFLGLAAAVESAGQAQWQPRKIIPPVGL